MPVNQETGAGKQSLVKEVKNWMLPPETAIPYRILTGITKGAEIATILIGLGATGIAVLTRVLIDSSAVAAISVGVAGLAGNIAVDSITTTNNRTRREREISVTTTQVPTQSSRSNR